MTIERHETPYLFASSIVTEMQTGESVMLTDNGQMGRRVLVVESRDAVIVETYRGSFLNGGMRLNSTRRLEGSQINTFKERMLTVKGTASFWDVLKGRTIGYRWKPDNS